MKLSFLFVIISVAGVIAISGCTSPLLNKSEAKIGLNNSQKTAAPSSNIQESSTSPTPQVNSKSPGTTLNPTVGGEATNAITPSPTQNRPGDKQLIVQEFDGAPLISSSSLNPSNPGVGETFTLSVTAQDDKGIKQFSWESSPTLSQGQTGSFDCNLQKTCSTKWEFSATTEGPNKITVYAIDSSGQKTKNDFSLNIGPARPIKSAIPTSSLTSPSPTATPTAASGCSSNSDCGYKQRCAAGNCIDVQCTTDSQCSGCKRCSDYSCRSCGYGPYGCTC